jgi:hypothetical protein
MRISTSLPDGKWREVAEAARAFEELGFDEAAAHDRQGGCAGILGLLAANIDAREFNPTFPATFPRFVQSAIWRYCAENGLDTCNGNRIDDDSRCDNGHCQLFRRCDRIALRAELKEKRLKSML